MRDDDEYNQAKRVINCSGSCSQWNCFVSYTYSISLFSLQNKVARCTKKGCVHDARQAAF